MYGGSIKSAISRTDSSPALYVPEGLDFYCLGHSNFLLYGILQLEHPVSTTREDPQHPTTSTSIPQIIVTCLIISDTCDSFQG